MKTLVNCFKLCIFDGLNTTTLLIDLDAQGCELQQ